MADQTAELGAVLTTAERWRLHAAATLDAQAEEVIQRAVNGEDTRVVQVVENILADRGLTARFHCETHLCGSCGGCKAAKIRDLLTEAEQREEALRQAVHDLTETWLSDGTGVETADDLYTADICAQQIRACLATPPDETHDRLCNLAASGIEPCDCKEAQQ